MTIVGYPDVLECSDLTRLVDRAADAPLRESAGTIDGFSDAYAFPDL